MDELIAFVRARLDEDEAFAQQFLEGLPDEYVGDLTPVQVFAMRALRQIAAKRALLVAYYDAGEFSDPWIGLDVAVRICAAVWDDHPDYRAEWAPR